MKDTIKSDKQIAKEAYKVAVESIQYHDYFRYRISYLSDPKFNLIFMLFRIYPINLKTSKKNWINAGKNLWVCSKPF